MIHFTTMKVLLPLVAIVHCASAMQEDLNDLNDQILQETLAASLLHPQPEENREEPSQSSQSERLPEQQMSAFDVRSSARIDSFRPDVNSPFYNMENENVTREERNAEMMNKWRTTQDEKYKQKKLKREHDERVKREESAERRRVREESDERHRQEEAAAAQAKAEENDTEEVKAARKALRDAKKNLQTVSAKCDEKMDVNEDQGTLDNENYEKAQHRVEEAQKALTAALAAEEGGLEDDDVSEPEVTLVSGKDKDGNVVKRNIKVSLLTVEFPSTRRSRKEDETTFVPTNLPICGRLWAILDGDTNGDVEEGETREVPCDEVSGKALEYVCRYLENFKVDEYAPIAKPIRSVKLHECEGVRKEDADFINDLDKNLIFEIILAANHLCITPLLHLGCAKIATLIKGKSPEDIKKILAGEEGDKAGNLSQQQGFGTRRRIAELMGLQDHLDN